MTVTTLQLTGSSCAIHDLFHLPEEESVSEPREPIIMENSTGASRIAFVLQKKVEITAQTRELWQSMVLRGLVEGTDGAEEDRLRRAMRVTRLLEEWRADTSGYDEETWPRLAAALEDNRLSSRKLFDGS